MPKPRPEKPTPPSVPSGSLMNYQRDDAIRALLDALAMPDGRDVRKTWDNACLLFGRFGSVMQRSAFEQYLDELAGIVK